MSLSKKLISELYKKIPEAPPCIRGCSKCCSQVPMLPIEAEVLELDYCATPITKNGNCAFFKSGECSVYANRPFICRVFNTTNDGCYLTCPENKAHGVSNLQDTDKLFKEYFAILDSHTDEEKARFEKAWIESEPILQANSEANGW